jgi:hypothetical protein
MLLAAPRVIFLSIFQREGRSQAVVEHFLRPADGILFCLDATTVMAKLTAIIAVAILSHFALTAASGTEPSVESARENAFFIFNSIHSAMRQWGSSMNHNGLALIPATLSKGTFLYHGSPRNTTPPGPEWLAFEVEHSENFARSWRPRESDSDIVPGDNGGVDSRDEQVRPFGSDNRQHILEETMVDGDKRPPPYHPPPRLPDKPVRGYFFTFQANRDLKLLYVDGMGAGKSRMGMLDTQDLVLRNIQNISFPERGEWERAQDLCDVISPWDYDGVIRMEIGFEIIYCNFSSGLDVVSKMRRPFMDEPQGSAGSLFSWARAVAQRYDGISADRVRLDFSRMVSGFFYPINVTNPDPDAQELPRLISATKEEHNAIHLRVKEVAEMETGSSVPWQGVVDMIVSRYERRLARMASKLVSARQFAKEVFLATNTYIDYEPTADDINIFSEQDRVRDATARCAEYYVLPVEHLRSSWTPEDKLIHTAISSVMERICSDIFMVRGVLLNAVPALSVGPKAATVGRDDNELEAAFRVGQGVIRALMELLRWTGWKKCHGCTVDEVCFIAMWPFGSREDHYNPSCQNETVLTRSILRDNYWHLKIR